MKSIITKAKKLFRKEVSSAAAMDTGSMAIDATLIAPAQTSESTDQAGHVTSDPDPIVIVGAGIVGLTLALALDKHCQLTVDIYEQAQEFHDDVGAGMGMYPNGLLVLRDISPEVFRRIQDEGSTFEWRRWERHDGSEIATANEAVLAPEDDGDLQPIGIRRWRLQRILLEAAEEAGIRIHFGMRLSNMVESQEHPDTTILHFENGKSVSAQLVVAADGSKSQVRSLQRTSQKHQLKYTGTSCLMGTATVPQHQSGLCLPFSTTTKCHGALYPTGMKEQCFQFHFPTPIEETEPVNSRDSGWGGGRTRKMEQEDCDQLLQKLQEDGWDDKYLQPLRNVDKALRIGFSVLEPRLKSYVFGRCVLVGDSAHPPVPYLGQGAQQGLEDAGTLAVLLKHYCCSQSSGNDFPAGSFSLVHVDEALSRYNQLRLPRTSEILNQSISWGKEQEKRATSDNRQQLRAREENLRRDVFFHETASSLLPAVRHDYMNDIEKALEHGHMLSVPE